jgi:hypothetical protein
VPIDPVQSMNAPSGTGCLTGSGSNCSGGGHNDLQVATGVYRREFGNCYVHLRSIGPCAAIVNSTGLSVTVKRSWLTRSYDHQITMDGGDVQSGGTIDPSGASFALGSSAVAADDAVLLAG